MLFHPTSSFYYQPEIKHPFSIKWLNVKWHARLNKHNTPRFKFLCYLLSIHVSFYYFLMTTFHLKKKKKYIHSLIWKLKIHWRFIIILYWIKLIFYPSPKQFHLKCGWISKLTLNLNSIHPSMCSLSYKKPHNLYTLKKKLLLV